MSIIVMLAFNIYVLLFVVVAFVCTYITYSSIAMSFNICTTFRCCCCICVHFTAQNLPHI